MPEIFSFCDNPLSCNTYVYIHGKEALIVDSSGQIEDIIELFKKYAIQRVVLAYTHGHFDHVAYGQLLQKSIQKLHINLETLAPKNDNIYFGKQGMQMLQDAIQKFKVSSSYQDAALPNVDTYFCDGDPIPFLDFVAIETPGHTQGSCCLYSMQDEIMFSGDTIFADGSIGRTDLFGGSYEQLQKSLTKLSSYSKDILLYPGHGHTDTLRHTLDLL